MKTSGGGGARGGRGRGGDRRHHAHEPVAHHDEDEDGNDVIGATATGDDFADGDDDDEHQHQHHHSLPEHHSPMPHPSSSSGCCNGVDGGGVCRRHQTTLTVVLAASLLVVSATLLLNMTSSRSHATTSSWSSHGVKFAPLPPSSQPLRRLAFGSCSDQTYPMPYWDALSKLSPDVTVLMGDNIYVTCGRDERDAGDDCRGTLSRAYEDLASHPSFIGAAETLPLLATLDDHDYGLDDCSSDNPYKHVAREIFLDFFGADDDDPRRSQVDGVYASHSFGGGDVYEDYEDGEGRVQIILLDARFSRSEFLPAYIEGMGEVHTPDLNDTSKTMLGSTQWTWLEDQLAQPADLRLIVSSIQVSSTGVPFECWRMLPNEQERLYNLIADAGGGGKTILLSGDRHVGGIYRTDPVVDDVGGDSSQAPISAPWTGPYPLVEVTSSSFTHTTPLGVYCNGTSEECDDVDPVRLYNYVRVNHIGLVDVDWVSRIANVSLVAAQTSEGARLHGHRGSDYGDVLQYVEVEF